MMFDGTAVDVRLEPVTNDFYGDTAIADRQTNQHTTNKIEVSHINVCHTHTHTNNNDNCLHKFR